MKRYFKDFILILGLVTMLESGYGENYGLYHQGIMDKEHSPEYCCQWTINQGGSPWNHCDRKTGKPFS